ncbi:hypothetical protein H6G89_23390 [Oscillatoria sp. FACHB-1407]|uniref:hypothetical protein n=1 Tax=Oscillatoria sp. FACHB-1407 TaxID=2692847 RepID=UPI00168509C3|nr:hypothetical protein [Oscillatoria sp. FACHB-1407]MBD2463950.1 hypothetical protein [Oscillatoria sp. FACHB-1407]
MDDLKDLKTALDIIVIIATLAQTFPPLAFFVGLGTIYVLVKDEFTKDDDEKTNMEKDKNIK